MEKKIYNAINSVLKAGSKDRHEPQMDRIEIFQDTLEWIRTDSDLSASVRKAKEKTKVFYEDDYPKFDSSRIKKQEVVVTDHRSFQAAMNLAMLFMRAAVW